MILGFGDAVTEDLWLGKESARTRRVPADLQQRVTDRLTMLSHASSVSELRFPPSNRLEQLKGDRAGFWSLRVNDQWRLIFRWDAGAAGPSAVQLIDYH